MPNTAIFFTAVLHSATPVLPTSNNSTVMTARLLCDDGSGFALDVTIWGAPANTTFNNGSTVQVLWATRRTDGRVSVDLRAGGEFNIVNSPVSDIDLKIVDFWEPQVESSGAQKKKRRT